MKPRHHQSKFWDKEYQAPTHLALSTMPAEDLEKFTRWLERQSGRRILNPLAKVLDLGCGNGRNLIYLAKTFGCQGVGYDNSHEAIKLAQAAGLSQLKFEVRSIADPFPLPDSSVNLALDLMSSHVLRAKERAAFLAEIVRVLKPNGWLLFKSFLLEEDDHAKRMLREQPAPPEPGQAAEPHAYIHPVLKAYEHVWTIEELEEFFNPYFEIHRIDKSHKHRSRGRAFRRRTVTVYLEKKP